MNKIAQMPIGLIVKKQFQSQYFPLKPTVFDNLIEDHHSTFLLIEIVFFKLDISSIMSKIYRTSIKN